MENSTKLLKKDKLETELLYDPAISLLAIYPKGNYISISKKHVPLPL
jgi:hypothetical protein